VGDAFEACKVCSVSGGDVEMDVGLEDVAIVETPLA
jgi:hypothetical protein